MKKTHNIPNIMNETNKVPRWNFIAVNMYIK